MGLGAITMENHLGDELRIEADEDGSVVLIAITGRKGETRTAQRFGTLTPRTGSEVRMRCGASTASVYIDGDPVLEARDNIPTGLEGCELRAVWS